MSYSPRRLAALALATMLLSLAGCGDDDDNSRPTPSPTATFTIQPTATSTLAATPTATVPQPTPSFTNTEAPAATSTSTVPPSATPTATTPPANFRDLSTALSASFVAGGSVGQVWVTDAAPGSTLELVGADSLVMMTGVADAQGSFIFRDVPVGEGYAVVSGAPGQLHASSAQEVTAPTDPPDDSFYDSQVINPGYGYLQTRDGTLLAINVLLPGPPENGPYPTVIEYSGYDPANPDEAEPGTLLAGVLGYAAVGVNMRGTGCSGGAFQFFEWLQSTDGYDAVEIIARQPWVKHNQVGMVGISYPGISQLFVAQLQPPSLAAISPMSVISDTGRGTLYPGGILNNGFATDWAAGRQHDAQVGGQPWSQKRIDAGDQICIANQKLRGQTPDIFDMIDNNQYYNPPVADPLSPVTFVHNINVPVFLAGAWQDEQTGGYFATMLDRFTGTDKVHIALVNGNHTESLIPANFFRFTEFLSFYIRREIPVFPPTAAFVLTAVSEEIFGASNFSVEPDRFIDSPSFEAALAEYEAEPRIRVLFDNGAGSTVAGSPIPAFEHSFPGWPVPGLVPTAFYFADDGQLVNAPPSTSGVDSFLYDDANAQRTTYTGSGTDIWKALPPWEWQPLSDGRAVAYATAPLDADLVMIGSGSVDLWIRASEPDVDLQVSLSEIRPDGKETYVQSGWLRASHRALDEAASTELRPVQSHLESAAAPLPSGELVDARVEIFPFAHAFRAGSRIRISVEAPGGDRPLWKFRALAVDATVEIERSSAHPSRVVLPVVPALDVPTGLPPCPSLRGQPCRTYAEIDNSVE
jgi:predicted acyl esterase